MLLIVADTVLKPMWTDRIVVAGLAVVLLVGFVAFVSPALRSEFAAAIA